MNDLPDLLALAVETTEVARKLFTEMRPGKLTQKSDRDFASELDFTVERTVRDILMRATPDIGFLGEEEGSKNVQDGQPYWVLDPVDGTANLVHGLPLCGVSLGLVRDGHPVLGVIDLPFINELYTATEGGGARLNDAPIHASTTNELCSAIVSLGDFAVGTNAQQRNERRHDILIRLAPKVERIRMLGSAAIDLAWVAAGRLDASIMMANKPWDVSAGVVIAREAGALVLDLDGTHHSLESRATVSLTPGLAKSLLATLG